MQGLKWPLFYSHIDHVWSLLIIGTGCTLGRAPRTKETLPDFREWRRITRHPRAFRGLTGCQRIPRFWGITLLFNVIDKNFNLLFNSFMGKKSYNKDEPNEVQSIWVMLVTQLILSSV